MSIKKTASKKVKQSHKFDKFDPRKAEKTRRIKLRPGPGRYFVLTPNNKELAHFEELSGPGGAKEYLDFYGEILPSGTEIVRRKDGKIMAFLSKTTVSVPSFMS